MGKTTVMKAPIRTPDFLLKTKGLIHTLMDDKSQKAKYHVSNQREVYRRKYTTRERDIRLKYKKLIDPVTNRKSALEAQLEEEKVSDNPEIRAHAMKTESNIRVLEDKIKSLEEEREMVISKTWEQYNQKISAYLHHSHMRKEDAEDEN